MKAYYSNVSLRHSVLDLPSSEEVTWTGLQQPWIIGVLIVYLIVFAFMIPGFLRFKDLVAEILIAMSLLCCIPMFIVNFIMSSKYPAPENVWSSLKTLTNCKVVGQKRGTKNFWVDQGIPFQFWVQMVVYVVASEMPGYNVLIGSYTAPGVLPNIAAVIVYTANFFILTLTLNCFSVTISLLKEHYKVINAKCFRITGRY